MKDTMKSLSNTIDNSKTVNRQLYQDGQILDKTDETQAKMKRNLDKSEKIMDSKNSFGEFIKGIVFGFNGKQAKQKK